MLIGAGVCPRRAQPAAPAPPVSDSAPASATRLRKHRLQPLNDMRQGGQLCTPIRGHSSAPFDSHARLLRRLPGITAVGPQRFQGLHQRAVLVPGDALDDAMGRIVP